MENKFSLPMGEGMGQISFKCKKPKAVYCQNHAKYTVYCIVTLTRYFMDPLILEWLQSEQYLHKLYVCKCDGQWKDICFP